MLGPFGTVSYYSYNNGYMGGKDGIEFNGGAESLGSAISNNLVKVSFTRAHYIGSCQSHF